MTGKMIFENYTIEQVEANDQVGYLVRNEKGHVCRLIRWKDGFDIAEEDKTCGLPADELSRISDFILEYDR